MQQLNEFVKGKRDGNSIYKSNVYSLLRQTLSEVKSIPTHELSREFYSSIFTVLEFCFNDLDNDWKLKVLDILSVSNVREKSSIREIFSLDQIDETNVLFCSVVACSNILVLPTNLQFVVEIFNENIGTVYSIDVLRLLARLLCLIWFITDSYVLVSDDVLFVSRSCWMRIFNLLTEKKSYQTDFLVIASDLVICYIDYSEIVLRKFLSTPNDVLAFSREFFFEDLVNTLAVVMGESEAHAKYLVHRLYSVEKLIESKNGYNDDENFTPCRNLKFFTSDSIEPCFKTISVVNIFKIMYSILSRVDDFPHQRCCKTICHMTSQFMCFCLPFSEVANFYSFVFSHHCFLINDLMECACRMFQFALSYKHNKPRTALINTAFFDPFFSFCFSFVIGKSDVSSALLRKFYEFANFFTFDLSGIFIERIANPVLSEVTAALKNGSVAKSLQTTDVVILVFRICINIPTHLPFEAAHKFLSNFTETLLQNKSSEEFLVYAVKMSILCASSILDFDRIHPLISKKLIFRLFAVTASALPASGVEDICSLSVFLDLLNVFSHKHYELQLELRNENVCDALRKYLELRLSKRCDKIKIIRHMSSLITLMFEIESDEYDNVNHSSALSILKEFAKSLSPVKLCALIELLCQRWSLKLDEYAVKEALTSYLMEIDQVPFDHDNCADFSTYFATRAAFMKEDETDKTDFYSPLFSAYRTIYLTVEFILDKMLTYEFKDEISLQSLEFVFKNLSLCVQKSPLNAERLSVMGMSGKLLQSIEVIELDSLAERCVFESLTILLSTNILQSELRQIFKLVQSNGKRMKCWLNLIHSLVLSSHENDAKFFLKFSDGNLNGRLSVPNKETYGSPLSSDLDSIHVFSAQFDSLSNTFCISLSMRFMTKYEDMLESTDNLKLVHILSIKSTSSDFGLFIDSEGSLNIGYKSEQVNILLPVPSLRIADSWTSVVLSVHNLSKVTIYVDGESETVFIGDNTDSSFEGLLRLYIGHRTDPNSLLTICPYGLSDVIIFNVSADENEAMIFRMLTPNGIYFYMKWHSYALEWMKMKCQHAWMGTNYPFKLAVDDFIGNLENRFVIGWFASKAQYVIMKRNGCQLPVVAHKMIETSGNAVDTCEIHSMLHSLVEIGGVYNLLYLYGFVVENWRKDEKLQLLALDSLVTAIITDVNLFVQFNECNGYGMLRKMLSHEFTVVSPGVVKVMVSFGSMMTFSLSQHPDWIKYNLTEMSFINIRLWRLVLFCWKVWLRDENALNFLISAVSQMLSSRSPILQHNKNIFVQHLFPLLMLQIQELAEHKESLTLISVRNLLHIIETTLFNSDTIHITSFYRTILALQPCLYNAEDFSFTSSFLAFSKAFKLKAKHRTRDNRERSISSLRHTEGLHPTEDIMQTQFSVNENSGTDESSQVVMRVRAYTNIMDVEKPKINHDEKMKKRKSLSSASVSRLKYWELFIAESIAIIERAVSSISREHFDQCFEDIKYAPFLMLLTDNTAIQCSSLKLLTSLYHRRLELDPNYDGNSLKECVMLCALQLYQSFVKLSVVRACVEAVGGVDFNAVERLNTIDSFDVELGKIMEFALPLIFGLFEHVRDNTVIFPFLVCFTFNIFFRHPEFRDYMLSMGYMQSLFALSFIVKIELPLSPQYEILLDCFYAISLVLFSTNDPNFSLTTFMASLMRNYLDVIEEDPFIKYQEKITVFYDLLAQIAYAVFDMVEQNFDVMKRTTKVYVTANVEDMTSTVNATVRLQHLLSRRNILFQTEDMCILSLDERSNVFAEFLKWFCYSAFIFITNSPFAEPPPLLLKIINRFFDALQSGLKDNNEESNGIPSSKNDFSEFLEIHNETFKIHFKALLEILLLPQIPLKNRLSLIEKLNSSNNFEQILRTVSSKFDEATGRIMRLVEDIPLKNTLTKSESDSCKEFFRKISSTGPTVKKIITDFSKSLISYHRDWDYYKTKRIANITKDINSAVSGLLEKFEVFFSDVSNLAIKAIEDAKRIEFIQQKEFVRYSRELLYTDLSSIQAWKTVIDHLSHERGVWFCARSFPHFWKLDFIESTAGERRRLIRSRFGYNEERFMLPENKWKLESECVDPPLHFILKPSSDSSAFSAVFLSRLDDDNAKFYESCRLLRPENEIKGVIVLGKEIFFYIPEHRLVNDKIRDSMYSFNVLDQLFTPITYEEIKEVHKRRYLLRDVAFEFYLLSGRSYFFAMNSQKERDDLLNYLKEILPNKSYYLSPIPIVQDKWKEGSITNFEYLLFLNKRAGRSFNDLMQYPVFPHIISDYFSEILNLTDSNNFRILSKPIAAQNVQRAMKFSANYEILQSTVAKRSSILIKPGPYHYASTYSNVAIVLQYLVRTLPFTKLFIDFQDHEFDIPDRSFYSLSQSFLMATKKCDSDFKELIPEFFYFPEFLENSEGFNFGIRQNGELVNDVELPPWALRNSRFFIYIHRQALESDVVTANLNAWIDLIFGYKQTGKYAKQALNVFNPICYYGYSCPYDINEFETNMVMDVLKTYGQIPMQLFKSPHPSRIVTTKDYEKKIVFPPNSIHSYVCGLKWGELVGSLEYDEDPFIYRIHGSDEVINELFCFDNRMYGLSKQFLHLMHIKERAEKVTLATVRYSLSQGSLNFDSLSKEPLYRLQLSTYLGKVEACSSFDPYIFVGFSCGIIGIYTLSTNEPTYSKATMPFIAHSCKISSLTTCPVHNLLVSTSIDGLLVTWDLNWFTFIRSHVFRERTITRVKISDTTSDIAVILKKSDICYFLKVFNCNLKEVGSYESSVPLDAIAFSNAPEGISVNVIVGGFRDGTMCFWSTWDLTLLRKFIPVGINSISALGYNKNHDQLYVATSDKKIVILRNKL